MFNFLKNISPTEIIIIVLILTLLFGARIIVKLARSSGESVRELKKVKKEFTQAVLDEDQKPK